MLSALGYLGLIFTSGMALFSVFFDFTEHTSATGRKTLNRAGRIAVSLTLISIAISFASAIAKDHLEDAQREKAVNEKAALQSELASAHSKLEFANSQLTTLRTELSLTNTRLTEIRIVLTFGIPVPWVDENFLQESTDQFAALSVVSGYSVIRHWIIHKNRKSNRYLEMNKSVMYVETRTEHIRNIFEQNEYPVRKILPGTMVFSGGLDDLDGLKDPRYLIFDSAREENPASHSRIEIDGSSMEIVNMTDTDFKDIVGSEVSFEFSMQAVERRTPIVQLGNRSPTIDDAIIRSPAAALFIMNLWSIDIYVNGRRLTRVYDAKSGISAGRFSSSRFDIEEEARYKFSFPEVELTRAMFIEAFKSAL